MKSLPINAASFALIVAGTKTIETRPASAIEAKVGDQLSFVNRDTSEVAIKTVTGVRAYPSSEELAAMEDLAKIGPYDTAAAYVAKMRQFQSDVEERAAGVVAIEFA